MRSPRTWPSDSVRPSREPITLAFCGPADAVAGFDADWMDSDRPDTERMDDPCLYLTITRALTTDSGKWLGALRTGLYSTATTAAPSAAVTATPRLIALSSRLNRAIELSERLSAPAVQVPRCECQSSGDPVATALRLCVQPDN